MTAVTFLAIRAAHILTAALWIGSTVFASALLMPAVDATGISGGQVMARLTRRGFPIYMSVIAATTLLSGVYLLWRFTGGFDPSVIHSNAGVVFSIGGSVVGRSGKQLTGLVGHAVTEADNDAHRTLLRRVDTLKRRMKIGTRAVIALQTVALIAMSVGHYV